MGFSPGSAQIFFMPFVIEVPATGIAIGTYSTGIFVPENSFIMGATIADPALIQSAGIVTADFHSATDAAEIEFGVPGSPGLLFAAIDVASGFTAGQGLIFLGQPTPFLTAVEIEFTVTIEDLTSGSLQGAFMFMNFPT